MNTLHLTYAVEVERCGSITQAAENLYMAQPNLSKAIKELEETMGFSIFSRTSRGVLPTERGKEFLIYARAILAEVKKMEELSTDSSPVRRFSLAMPPSGYISDCVYRTLELLEPDVPVDISIRESEPRQVLSGVSDGAFRLGILRVAEEAWAEPNDARLTRDTLWEYDALAIFSERHPLARAKRISANDLDAYPLVKSHGADALRGNANRILADSRAQQLNLLAHSSAFLWSSPEPPGLLRRYGVIQRACKGAPRFRDILIFPADQTLFPLEQRFIKLLREACANLSGQQYS